MIKKSKKKKKKKNEGERYTLERNVKQNFEKK